MNGDKKITQADLEKVMPSLGLGVENAKEVMQRLEKNRRWVHNSGGVHSRVWGEGNNPLAMQSLMEVFDMNDLDQDGEISAEELPVVLLLNSENLSLPSCENLTHSFDLNENGSLNFKEFMLMISSCSTPSLPMHDKLYLKWILIL